MARIIKSKRALHKLKGLPVDGQEPLVYDKVHQLRQGCDAGSKGARDRGGRLQTAELGSVYKGGPGHVLYTNADGMVVEQDVRPLEEKAYKEKMIDKARVKEATQFRYAVIVNRARVHMRRLDKIVLMRMCKELVANGLPQSELKNSNTNPYTTGDYQVCWNVWASRVVGMKFKQAA
jgi:hypothetical protein